MKRKNLIIICFSVFLLLVAGFVGIKETEWNRTHSISVEILSDGRTEEVKLWMGPGEMYYLFLPSYADLSQTQVRRNVMGPVLLDYQKVRGSMDCSDLPLNEPVTLIQDSILKYQWNELTIMQSKNVPTMYIDVRSGNMDYIHEKKGNKESGSMRLYTAEGALDAVAVVESIQGRGNSTWQWREKKPYSIRLGAETDLLGMGAASRWILLADAFDLSGLKNKMAYDLAADAGMPYAPDCQWVDLYLNGEYAGLYLLSERNEIHPNRVDIPEESSFLVAWESEQRMIDQGYPHVVTEREKAIRIHQSALPLEEVRQIWQSVENAIYAQDSIDPVTGKHLQDLIDIDSWAMLFLMDEIPADYDGGKISKFFYYTETDGVGKVYGGPVWDKDDTFCTGHWSVTPPNSIAGSRSSIRDGKEYSMFAGLYQKEFFRTRVAEIYQESFLPVLEELYDSGIAEYADRIAQAAELSEVRWNLGYTPEQSKIIRDFLGARMDFFEDYWILKKAFHRVVIHDHTDGGSGEYAVLPGDKIPVLPGYEPEQGVWGWYLTETGEPFDVTQPIWEDVELNIKKIGT